MVFNIIDMVRIIIFSIILFVSVPLFIEKPRRGNFLECIVKGFSISIFSAIIIGYFLLVTRMYELISFVALFFPTVIFIYFWIEGIKLRNLNIRKRIVDFAVELFNRIERRSRNGSKLLRVGGWKSKDTGSLSGKTVKKHKTTWASRIWLIIVICVFAYILLLRLEEILPHKFLYFADSYVHLMLTKLFITGKVMYEKFYPLAYHSIVAAVKTVSFCDITAVFRFFGPIQSAAIVFSVYCFVSMVTKNRYAALLAAAILGLDSLDIWPLVFYRQLVALPQEFATIFFLPTLYFCLQYLKRQKSKYLKYFFISLCNILLIHVYVAVLLLPVLLGVFVVGVLFRLWKKNTFSKVFYIGVLSCTVGSIPFVLWKLLGLVFDLPNRQGELFGDSGFIFRYININAGFQGYLNFLKDALNPIKDPLRWHNQVSANIILYSLIFAAVYLLLRGILRRRFFLRHFYLLALIIGQMFFVAFYYGFKYDLISIMYFERIGLVLSLCSAAIIGLLFNELFILTRNRGKSKILKILVKYPSRIILTSVVYSIVFLMVICLPYEKTDTIVYQYEVAFKAYEDITKRFEILDWTIVSPVEELSLSYGCGWHYELWKFLEDFSINDARNMNFDFGKKIPSQHIFIFIEKEPLLIWYTVPSAVQYVSETEIYYRMYNGRSEMEKQIGRWMEEYTKSHEGLSNNAKIFYQDEEIIVYHIQHKVEKK